MSELATTRTLEVIGAEIRALTASMLGNVIEIGRRMVEAKELLPHGEFGPWIKENTGYSNSTANNFMRLFLEYGNKQASLFGAEVENFQTFGNLSYTKALALLALPSEEEREEFVETHDVENMSTRELQQAIKERDDALKAKAAAEAREKEAREELAETAEMLDKTLDEKAALSSVAKEYRDSADELEKELEELKSRPVEVAVSEPDPEEVEKRAAELAREAREEAAAERQVKEAMKASLEATEKKAAEDLKKAKERAKAEREKLEQKLKEAEAKIASAGAEEKEEAEKLRAETEALKKRLAMNSQEVTIFKLRFSAWQDAHRLMTEAFNAIQDEETKEKLRKAISAQVESWGYGET